MSHKDGADHINVPDPLSEQRTSNHQVERFEVWSVSHDGLAEIARQRPGMETTDMEQYIPECDKDVFVRIEDFDRLRAALEYVLSYSHLLEDAPARKWIVDAVRKALGGSPDETSGGLVGGCHRSHPHEDMPAECQLKAARSFIRNRFSRLPTNRACETTQTVHERALLETLEACIADARPAAETTPHHSPSCPQFGTAVSSMRSACTCGAAKASGG